MLNFSACRKKWKVLVLVVICDAGVYFKFDIHVDPDIRNLHPSSEMSKLKLTLLKPFYCLINLLCFKLFLIRSKTFNWELIPTPFKIWRNQKNRRCVLFLMTLIIKQLNDYMYCPYHLWYFRLFFKVTVNVTITKTGRIYFFFLKMTLFYRTTLITFWILDIDRWSGTSWKLY